MHVQEAKEMLQRRLPLPAYDHLLKLSHAFNILDARGAVSHHAALTPPCPASRKNALAAGLAHATGHDFSPFPMRRSA